MTLEDVPPGTQPTKIRPSATSEGNWKSCDNAKAERGMNKYCAKTTMKTCHGFFITSLKSAGFIVSPIVNMINCRIFVKYPAAHKKLEGRARERIATPTTMKDKY